MKKFQTGQGRSVYRLPIPTPFPVGDVNGYLIEGSPWTLVDTGPHSNQAMGAVEEGLKEIGLGFGDVGKIVVTHGHMDHHGLTAALLERAPAKVYVHRYDVGKVADFETHFQSVRERYLEFLRLCGVAPQAFESILSVHNLLRKFCRPARVDVPLEDGTAVDGGIRVIHTPGHQEGSICLQVDDLLLTGDHILGHISPNPFCKALAPYCGLAHYIESLQRVLSLEGVSRALPGHGAEIGDLKERVETLLEHHRRRSDVILQACAKTHTVFDLALSKEVFPDGVGRELLLAMVEVVSHLELLEESGKIRRQMRDGVGWFSPS